MDRHLRGLKTPPPPRVRVFVMGENAWRKSEGWPIDGASERTLRLSAAKDGGPGGLVAAPGEVRPGSRSFLSDPRAPVTDSFAPATGAHDYRALAQRSDVAVFETEPLTGDLTVVGRIRAEIDVAPDGTAFNLMSPGLDLLRASYRDGGPERQLLQPGEPVRLRFDDLMTGNRFARGHRLRLVLTSSFHPHFSRNLHTGEDEAVSSRSRPAKLDVLFDAEHASRLVLPVLEGGQR
jgi:putative CocE/NonD family hydrolase